MMLGLTPKDFDVVTDAHPTKLKTIYSIYLATSIKPKVQVF
jgi:tRNA nucleotidyltransferase/poly(A) polymerase